MAEYMTMADGRKIPVEFYLQWMPKEIREAAFYRFYGPVLSPEDEDLMRLVRMIEAATQSKVVRAHVLNTVIRNYRGHKGFHMLRAFVWVESDRLSQEQLMQEENFNRVLADPLDLLQPPEPVGGAW